MPEVPRSPQPKRLGCCTQCDEPLFEVVERFPENLADGKLSPLARRPRRIGKQIAPAYRCHLLLMDGSQMPLTFCEKCKDNMDLDAVWQRVLVSMAEQMDPTFLEIINAPAHTPRQLKIVDRFFKKLHDNVPLGVLATEVWGG